jgi:hypothetical protein
MSKQTLHRLVCWGALLGVCGCAAPATLPEQAPDLANILQQAAQAETSVVNVATPAPCCPRQTLPEFLGFKCLMQGVCGAVNQLRNCLGMAFPGLEATPPLLAITDPANMSEDAPPAVQAAADIKSQEDQAAQKIKAIRYLATIGCGGCYPDVEDALIAAMDDCTEAVRYEAVKAVRETASGGGDCCTTCCAYGACCSEKMQNKLKELAYGKKDCCAGEPSARVRRQARLALAACGPPVVQAAAAEPEPAEGPTEGPTEGPANGEGAPGSPEEAAPEDRVTSAKRAVPVRTAEVLSQPSSVNPEQGRSSGHSLEPLPPVLPIFP